MSLWSALQSGPGIWLSIGASGKAAVAGWLLFVGEIAVAFGLLVPVIAAWYATLASLAASVLALSAALWICVFIAAAWGLHSSELLAAIAVGVYFVFLCWGFIYLFHPDVESYFRRVVNAPSS